jgi:hypothetical protein
MGNGRLAGQPAEKLVFVETVFEGFTAVDENYRDLVGETTA